MKNKICISIMLILLGLLFVNDTALLIKVLERPHLFSGVSGYSPIHYILFGEYKVEFAILKLVFTLLIFSLWLAQIFKRCWPRGLANVTAGYVMFLLMMLLLIATTIAGILQQVAGMPVNLFNSVHILSVASGGYTNLLVYVCVGLSFPTLLFVFSSSYASKAQV